MFCFSTYKNKLAMAIPGNTKPTKGTKILGKYAFIKKRKTIKNHQASHRKKTSYFNICVMPCQFCALTSHVLTLLMSKPTLCHYILILTSNRNRLLCQNKLTVLKPIFVSFLCSIPQEKYIEKHFANKGR